MEEDSESRSDRLKAMRGLAANSLPTLDATQGPGLLANPMLDGPSVAETAQGGPRFDFYTDPMAAFSGTRNMNPPAHVTPRNFAPQGGRGPPAWTPPPPWPGPRNPSPTSGQGHRPGNQGMYRASGPYDGFVPYGSQGGGGSPFPFHQGPPQQPIADPAANYGYRPNPRYQGYPNYQGSPSVTHGQGGNARWVGGNTPRPNSDGRGGGQGRWHGGNRSPGFGRGRGRGFQNHDGKVDPERFYHASMMKDPWDGLEAIEWKRITAGSWMRESESSSVKRARVSEASSNQFNSGQSLADYLAASFNEASNTDPNT